jgi:hypothetical protein
MEYQQVNILPAESKVSAQKTRGREMVDENVSESSDLFIYLADPTTVHASDPGMQPSMIWGSLAEDRHTNADMC